MNSDPELVVSSKGRLGILTLNRPQWANALTLDMIQGIASALANFAIDPDIGAVLIRSVGPSFSSGGDVVNIVRRSPGSDFDDFRRVYFASEYALNYRIYSYPKPYIAIIDGLTMGGGCGVSLHGSHVVATERTIIAMPETGIGHFPDAGASAFLNRMPGEMGVYAGLRGARLNAADAIGSGLANYCIESRRSLEMSDALAGDRALTHPAVDRILKRFSVPVPESRILGRLSRINALFGQSSLETIKSSLKAADESWAQASYEALNVASPRSLKVTLKMLRDARHLSVADALRTEYRICMRVTGSHDFREGIEAALVRKDNKPRWQPERIEELRDSEVEAYFLPLAPVQSELDLTGQPHDSSEIPQW